METELTTNGKILNQYTNGLITAQETIDAIHALKKSKDQTQKLQLFITAMREADIAYSQVKKVIHFILESE